MVAVSTFTRQNLFLRTPRRATVLFRSLIPMKNRKKSSYCVMFTAATHAKRVHDVTDLVKVAAPMALFSRLSNVDF